MARTSMTAYSSKRIQPWQEEVAVHQAVTCPCTF